MGPLISKGTWRLNHEGVEQALTVYIDGRGVTDNIKVLTGNYIAVDDLVKYIIRLAPSKDTPSLEETSREQLRYNSHVMTLYDDIEKVYTSLLEKWEAPWTPLEYDLLFKFRDIMDKCKLLLTLYEIEEKKKPEIRSVNYGREKETRD